MVTRDTTLIPTNLDQSKDLGSGAGVFDSICNDLTEIYRQLKLNSDDTAVVEGGSDPYQAGNEPQHFVLRIARTAGNLVHNTSQPMDPSDSGGPVLASAVNDPTNSFFLTPTGTDSSTAMVRGMKISSVNPERIYFDTADIQPLAARRDSAVSARVLNTDQSSLGYAVAVYVSATINGDTRRRLAVDIFQSDGTVFDIATALNLDGEFMDVEIKGWMPPFV